MKRLHGLDTALLATETRVAPFHMMAILRLDPGTVPGGYSFEALRDFIASRLPVVPPLRYRLLETPLHLAAPVWAELDHVDINNHVKRAALPTPGGDKELAELTAQLAEIPLDRRQPLWEMHVVEELASDEIAVVAKVHHALMDGVAGMEFMASLFSLEPEIPTLEIRAQEKGDRLPNAVELAVRSVPHVVTRTLRALPLFGRTVWSIGRGIGRLTTRPAPTRASSGPVVPAPRVPWSHQVTRRRNVAFLSLPLDDVKRVAKDADVKLNDVVLTLVGGAARRYLVARDSLPDAPLVAGVPVSVRDGGNLAGNNAVSAIFVSLGTDVEDPRARLQAVHEHATQAKELHDAVGAAGFADWTEVFAPAVFSLGAQLLIDHNLLVRLPVLCNTVVSNVPGPPVTLYFGGARLSALYPLGPIFTGPGINVTIVSARDTIGFGLLSCPDLVPDLWEIADAIRDELAIQMGAHV